MKLLSFSISNYRSIISAKEIPLADYTVMIGANNEGKSNILHALTLGMNIIESFKDSVVRDRLGRIRSARLFSASKSYNWLRDFPVSLQNSQKRDLYTEILFNFSLSRDENEAFQHEIGSKLNESLPILIRLSKNDINLIVVKPGKGSGSLNKKTNKIADFISRNLSFDYIPAVRTSDSSEEVLIDLISKELTQIETKPEYIKALDEIRSLQEPILSRLSESVTSTISSFLPSVTSVHIDMPQDARYRAFRRSLEISVDDGNNTPLERKGDGVKSLVALALMRYASESSTNSTHSIVAVEEPEAHLHPQAIHELRDVLIGLSKKNQIILTSHSPLFVNPANLNSTIVVNNNKASPATNISEIRNVLGVRLSDNLQSAKMIAIVEGDDDIIILKSLLSNRYPEIKSAIDSGDLVFDALGGASNLSYKIRLYRGSATLVHCFLDNDAAGIRGLEKATKENLIRIADYNLMIVPGQAESELEDILDPKKYRDAFLAEFFVDPCLNTPAARGKKWSDAMAKIFQAQGKMWGDRLEMQVKLWLANYASENIEHIVIEPRFSPIEAFANSLISKMELRK